MARSASTSARVGTPEGPTPVRLRAAVALAKWPAIGMFPAREAMLAGAAQDHAGGTRWRGMRLIGRLRWRSRGAC